MLKRDKSSPSNNKPALVSFISGSGAISTSITCKLKGHKTTNLNEIQIILKKDRSIEESLMPSNSGDIVTSDSEQLNVHGKCLAMIQECDIDEESQPDLGEHVNSKTTIEV